MRENIKRFIERYIYAIITIFLGIIIALTVSFYKQRKKCITTSENQYNLSFYQLIDYVQDLENYLAKSTVSGSPENEAETLMHVWREANLAEVYLSELPIASKELANTAKFLNQVSEYSYSLGTKSINKESLSQEELNKLEELYNYSINLKNILSQLSEDMNQGKISWRELTKNINLDFAQQVNNISVSSFSNIDSNFGEYAGLIYDGAYSEHIEKAEKKGLVGEDITEERAKQLVLEFIGQERIANIEENGLVENGDIQVYNFLISIVDGEKSNPANISISKKGGHIVLMNYNRIVSEEKITQEEANEVGKKFLDSRNILNMKPTYYLKEGGVATINYAYVQDDVIIYPDLIKLKIALDNGEILGMETEGYLNNHTERLIEEPKISMEEAKKNLNKNLQITSSGMAIIPTEWRTEKQCYEFKGKVNDTDFLVYVNTQTGKEEDILVIVDTPNGILTQ